MSVKLELQSPVSFQDATDRAKELIVNGAGPRKWGWTVPDTLYGLSITDAANIHDWGYAEARTNDDRLNADMLFLRNMVVLILIEDMNSGWLGRRLTFLRLSRAIKYFVAVWRLGKHFANIAEDGQE